MRAPRTYGLVLLLLACAGCYSLPRKPGAPLPPATGYSTHIVVYQQLRDVDQSLLEHYDFIIVGRSGYDELEPRFMRKAFLYIDIWCTGRYSYPEAELARGFWQPGPGNLGLPRLPLEFTPGREIYCYPFDAQHPARFQGWCERALTHGARGIFCDDWSPDRFHWLGPDAIKAAAWPGFPDNATVFSRLREAEVRVLDAVREARGEAGMVIFNGPGTRQRESAVFHENVGHGRQSWDLLTGFTVVAGDTVPVNRHRYIGDGRFHLLQVNGLDAEGELTRKGRINFDRAVREALRRPGRISVGLAHEERPVQGGSIYQIPRGPWADPRRWPSYHGAGWGG